MGSQADAALIETLYTAFADRDAEAMADCYHPEATFRDPVFTLSGADEVGSMWTMLIKRGKDTKIRHRDVWAKDERGGAHWDADYTFSATGRFVNNEIDAAFRFEDGKIIEHIDTFDMWKWTRMALGMPGVFLGWSGFLQSKVKATARKSLDAFMAAERV